MSAAPASTSNHETSSDNATEIAARLRQVAGTATGRQSFYRDALQALGEHFDAPFAAIQVDLSSATFADEWKHGTEGDAQWEQICGDVLLDVRYRANPVAKLFEASELDQRFAVLGVPLVDDTIVGGAVVVVTPCASKELATAKLRELQAIESHLSLVAPVVDRQTAGGGRDRGEANAPEARRRLARAGRYESLRELAYDLVNELKSHCDLEQVSWGWMRRQRIQLVAISGCTEVKVRSPAVQLIADAMEEAADRGQAILASDRDDEETQYLLHRRWSRSTAGTVGCLPLMGADGTVWAVLALRARPGESLTVDVLDQVQQLAEPLVPAMQLLERASRPFNVRLQATLATTARSLLSRSRRTYAVLVIALALWMVCGTLPFSVTAPCRVVSEHERLVAAPFAAVITDARCQAGDTVKEGDLLVVLDTRELEAETTRLSAEMRIAQVQLDAALSEHRSAEAARYALELESLFAQLDVVQQRRTLATVTAPFDAVVLEGNVRDRMGEMVPLGAPLLRLAQRGDLCVEIATPSRSVPYVEAGLGGVFITENTPDRPWEIEVDAVHQSSSIVQGDTAYVVKARLTDPPQHTDRFVCLGIEGFAKVRCGRRPVWWILTHRAFEFLRLQAWKI